MTQPHPYWPFYQLRLRTPEVELRLPTEAELIALAQLAAGGIHNSDFQPFSNAWTAQPSPELERGLVQWHWSARANWKPEQWSLELGVFHRRQPIGVQGLHSEHFPVLRSVSTGSWLGQRWQGRGFGKQMRAAVLHLAFAGLGADEATTDAREGNQGSNGVTRSLGYEPCGSRRQLISGTDQWYEQLHYRMTRQQWQQRCAPHYPVEMTGLAESLPLFGLVGVGEQPGD